MRRRNYIKEKTRRIYKKKIKLKIKKEGINTERRVIYNKLIAILLKDAMKNHIFDYLSINSSFGEPGLLICT